MSRIPTSAPPAAVLHPAPLPRRPPNSYLAPWLCTPSQSSNTPAIKLYSAATREGTAATASSNETTSGAAATAPSAASSGSVLRGFGVISRLRRCTAPPELHSKRFSALSHRVTLFSSPFFADGNSARERHADSWSATATTTVKTACPSSSICVEGTNASTDVTMTTVPTSTNSAASTAVPVVFAVAAPEQQHACLLPSCPALFSSLAAASAHYSLRHAHRCRACPRCFPSARALSQHFAEAHDAAAFAVYARARRMYECVAEGCATAFWRERQRDEHLVTVHFYPKGYTLRHGHPVASQSSRSDSQAAPAHGHSTAAHGHGHSATHGHSGAHGHSAKPGAHGRFGAAQGQWVPTEATAPAVGASVRFAAAAAAGPATAAAAMGAVAFPIVTKPTATMPAVKTTAPASAPVSAMSDDASATATAGVGATETGAVGAAGVSARERRRMKREAERKLGITDAATDNAAGDTTASSSAGAAESTMGDSEHVHNDDYSDAKDSGGVVQRKQEQQQQVPTQNQASQTPRSVFAFVPASVRAQRKASAAYSLSPQSQSQSQSASQSVQRSTQQRSMADLEREYAGCDAPLSTLYSPRPAMTTFIAGAHNGAAAADVRTDSPLPTGAEDEIDIEMLTARLARMPAKFSFGKQTK